MKLIAPAAFALTLALTGVASFAQRGNGSPEAFKRAVTQFPSNPEFAATQACSEFRNDRAQCVEGLRPLIEAEKQRIKANSDSMRERDIAEADARDAESKRKFDNAYKPALAAYIATGNTVALNNNCFKTGDAYKCMNMAFGERVKALKEGRVEPVGCREVGLAKGYFLNGADPMKVSLEAAKAPGIFEGEVTQIEGRRLTIFNAATRQNALVSIEGAKVYGGERIAVGAPVVGYGTHAGSVQGRLVTGAPTTIAKIAAECVGDS